MHRSGSRFVSSDDDDCCSLHKNPYRLIAACLGCCLQHLKTGITKRLTEYQSGDEKLIPTRRPSKRMSPPRLAPLLRRKCWRRWSLFPRQASPRALEEKRLGAAAQGVRVTDGGGESSETVGGIERAAQAVGAAAAAVVRRARQC